MNAEWIPWVGFAAIHGRASVPATFMNLPEFRGDLVESYYVTLVHRPSDPTGLDFWVGAGLAILCIAVLVLSFLPARDPATITDPARYEAYMDSAMLLPHLRAGEFAFASRV